MNINKLPLEDRQKIKANINKIAKLNSSELLSYNKLLNAQKDNINTNVRNFLFEAIDARTDTINSTSMQVIESENDRMVKMFLKRGKK